MLCIPPILVISFLVGRTHSLFIGNGSYNSFLQQVGFCKLQGFDTISRNTSLGPPLLTSGLIKMGVGLSHVQFQHNISNCGRCIQILDATGIPEFDDSLTSWSNEEALPFPSLVFVMDECKDEICGSGYLDFDIYNPRQPVQHGNPYGIVWEFVDCPEMPDHEIEFLICMTDSCKEGNPEGRSVGQVLDTPVYFWSVYIRNSVIPVFRVRLLPSGDELRAEEGWVWDYGIFSFPGNLILEVNDHFEFTLDLDEIREQQTTPGYRGGILVAKKGTLRL